MFEVRVINQEEIKTILSMEDVIQAVEEVYSLKSMGKTEVFPILTHDFEPGVSDFDIKSGYIPQSGIYGMKTVSYFSGNTEQKLPNLIGTLSVYSARTGAPLGIMDATFITCARTGAAGAIGIKHLAREDAEEALVIGAGKQALFQIAALLCVRQNIKAVHIYDKLSGEQAERLAQSVTGTLRAEFGIDVQGQVKFLAAEDLEAAAGACGIIITATPSREAIVMDEWIKPGTHFSCVGSDTSGKQEIDERIIARARVFADDIDQCVAVGEVETAIKKGLIKKSHIAGEVGDVINKSVPGRIGDSDITVFDTTGIAVQDLCVAQKVLEAAEARGMGSIVRL